MDTKWTNTQNETGENIPKKKLGFKAVCGFLAFVLGFTLLVEGVLFFGVRLTSFSERQLLLDSFQDDYQDTQQFRDYVSEKLETLISMATGEPGYNNYYDYYYGSWHVGNDAAARHKYMSKDKNFLYTVVKGDEVLYTSSPDLTAKTTVSTLPEGYGFLLQFDGEKVRIWQDAEELDIYGDGYYDYETNGRWYVPGYENFEVDETVAQLQVTIAILDKPREFINGTMSYNYLYQCQNNLQALRQSCITHLALLGVSVVLIAVYLLLRKDKTHMDQALARGTGKVWFEFKVIAFLILLVCLLPRLDYYYDYAGTAVSTSTPVSEVFISEKTAEATTQGSSMVVYDMTSIHDENTLQDYLVALAVSPTSLLMIFWSFYLLIFNDWRYNKKPWRHGIFGLLAARELKHPIQKRLSRMAGIIWLAFGVVLLVVAFLFVEVARNYSAGPVWWFLVESCVVALVLVAWTLKRQRNIWLDLGAISDQISCLRAGQVDEPLELPPDHDLYQAADDLNHVQQGLHQAVEERTRSERMKVELVTNVSHDLKTPLTSIISYTELLAQEPLEPPASEYVQILNEKSQRLKIMVQDVFEISKAASNQLPVKLETLDFGRLLRQTLADMSQAIDESGLTLRAAIPEEPVPITADSDRMYRVFQNLVSNALKYSLPGSRVYLTLTVEGDQATASVKNTSNTELKPGVDYTGRFVRGDGSRTDGGSGLGLSIADSFTSACGGTLSVTTEADLFIASVTFPLSE